jgi:CheY-like chemotaxis protein/HPt (histidine-containing phosphotransfer) domain-containing protein
MGGTIGLDSEVGVGSRFWFELTLTKATAKEVTPSVAPPDLADKQVFLLDDNSTNLKILTEYVKAWGMVPTCAETVPKAFELLKEAAQSGQPYPLAILDVRLAGRLDGLEVAKTLSTEKRFRDTQVVMLSSVDGEVERQACRDIGVRFRLTKPVRRAELLETITAAIHTPRKHADSNIRLPALPSSREMEETSNARILLVEDHPINREVAISVLAVLGHECATAYNGREALDKLEEEDFDLVLMDCQMPEMDGFEATQRIRQREAREHHDGRIPIIALTANALKGDQERCIRAGMDDYLAKPFNKQQLQQTLDKWLKHKPNEAVQTAQNSGDDDIGGNADRSAAIGDPSSVLDPDTLAMLRELDTGGDFLLRLIAAFLDKTPIDVDQIKGAVEAGDASALRLAAHAFKSSSRNLGAVAVATLCESLEMAGREEDLSKAPEMVKRLDIELELAFAALKDIQSDPQRKIC